MAQSCKNVKMKKKFLFVTRISFGWKNDVGENFQVDIGTIYGIFP